MVLKSTLGSCVGLTVFDPVTKFGGLAHILLSNSPKRKSRANNLYPGTHVELAVSYMLEKFKDRNIPISRLEAKIAGGASMFSSSGSKIPVFDIGERNVDKTVELLRKAGVRIVGRDTGKDIGRTMFLLTNGRVVIREPVSGKERFI
ncbi:MAG: chemotaxis protein CheD [Candidatus Odinarchaeota archaeon]